MHETKNAQKKIFAMRKLMNVKLKEGQFVYKHFDNFKEWVSEFHVIGLSLDDEIQPRVILGYLPNFLVILVISLNNTISKD